jgi:hypothetical protein
MAGWVGGTHWLGIGCRHIADWWGGIVARERRHWLAGWVLGADILRLWLERGDTGWLAGFWVQTYC